eukprot:COSAG01_NODE_34197_length_551_cov_2.245575_1_plen_62_part_10
MLPSAANGGSLFDSCCCLQLAIEFGWLQNAAGSDVTSPRRHESCTVRHFGTVLVSLRVPVPL